MAKSRNNILCNSFAGTGKTTMLGMIDRAEPEKPVLFMAFNRRIADEAIEKQRTGEAFDPNTTIKTINGMGDTICRQTFPGYKCVYPEKMINLLRQTGSELKGEDRRDFLEVFWDILGATSLAKSLGYIPGKYSHVKGLISKEDFYARLDFDPSPLTKELIDSTLSTSIQVAYEGSIDFNDQVYMPALFAGSFPRFPTVLVDEYQDLSPTNIALLEKLARGRLGAVGDRWQSIYGFRGADTKSYEKLKEKFKMEERDLSVSFRCPQAIVELARWRVPQFKWIKPGGKYEILKSLSHGEIPDHAAIICRNNAPIFSIAFKLLEAGRSVSVAGSDIGPRLIGILSKLGPTELSRANLLIRIEEWKEAKLERSTNSQTIEDMAACMAVFASYGADLGQAITFVKKLFAERGSIQLTTGHKAKGLEWEAVYFLDPWLVKGDDQDLNLRYVIQTRSAGELYEINSREIKW